MGLRAYFKCGVCDELHDSEDEAIACCEPMISEVYLCPSCYSENCSEDAALECCGTDADFTPPPTAQELEAAGQQRLLP